MGWMCLFLVALLVDYFILGDTASECCKKKKVGTVEYSLSREGPTGDYGCIDECIYRQDGDGATSQEFCFKKGSQQAECRGNPGQARPVQEIQGGLNPDTGNGQESSGFTFAYLISSYEGALQSCPSCMGIYRLTGEIYYTLPVYKHQTEEMYLFYAEGDWVVNQKPDPTSAMLYTTIQGNSDLPPENGWLHWLNGKWTPDPSFSVDMVDVNGWYYTNH